jgi:hypothetical protein
MNQLHAWIDVDEFKRLAESLMIAANSSEVLELEDEEPVTKFVGFMDEEQAVEPYFDVFVEEEEANQYQGEIYEPSVELIVDEKESVDAEELVEEAELVDDVEPIESSSIVELPALQEERSFDLKMRDFSEKFTTLGLAKSFFVLDHEHQVIFDEGNHSRLHFMARDLSVATKNSAVDQGFSKMKVGSRANLFVIPAHENSREMSLAILSDQVLSTEDVGLMSEIFRKSLV